MKVIVDLPVEPGVYTEQTARGIPGRWKDTDKVRFRYGLIEKVGGWVRLAGQFLGFARRLWDWASLDGRLWVAIGTTAKLYLRSTTTMHDITPIRASGALTNPFDTTTGSAIVLVTHIAHGAQAGDYVRFSGFSAVGGLTVDGEYQIVQIVSADEYRIIDNQTASGTANGGGSGTYEYDISVGAASTTFGRGWSAGTWSFSTWSTPRNVTEAIIALRTWSLDNWGEDLIACPRGGGIFWWDRSSGASVRATQLTNAPARCNMIIISQQNRHLFALGCTDAFTGLFDPLLIRWCSQDNLLDWSPTQSNTAGDLRIYRGSKIVSSVRTRNEILVFTDASVHQLNFLGSALGYGIGTVAENVSILGPNAVIEVDYRVYFMTDADFYVYDGVAQPLPCEVRALVFENLNTFQKDKVFAGLNRDFNEIWFFYPGKASDVWMEADFSSGALANFFQIQSMAGTPRYSIGFNSLGYITLTDDTDIGAYDKIYYLSNDAVIETPGEADYEVVFSIATTAFNGGVMMNVSELTGTADTSQDNIVGIDVRVVQSSNLLVINKRNALGAPATLTNGAASYALGSLPTPVTLTVGRKYGLILTRSANSVSARIWDEFSGTTQLVATVALDSAEVTAYPGTGTAGPLLRGPNATPGIESGFFHSFRSAPAGVLVAQTQRGVASEVNRYVIYNYQEQRWAIGTMSRTAWHRRSPVFEKPYAAGDDGYLYQHETGKDDDSSPMEAYAETYDMELPEAGEMLMHVDQLIPDFKELQGSVDISLKAKAYPADAVYIEKGPYVVDATTRKVSTRARGRQISLRIESDALGDRWRMGTMRARISPHGKRA